MAFVIFSFDYGMANVHVHTHTCTRCTVELLLQPSWTLFIAITVE